jgi:iron complex outermembrane recepter protein
MLIPCKRFFLFLKKEIMMNKSFVTILCMLLVLTSQAQKLAVTILCLDAQTQQPIANVKLGNQLSNANGLIILNASVDTSINNQLQFSCAGYEKLTTNFGNAVKNSEFNFVFYLTKKIQFSEAVEVKGIRASNLAPFTKTNISKDEFQQNNLGQDLPFLLNATPSLVANSDAGNGIGYTGIRIRGTDATRINMTINGIPYNDAESQGLFLVNLPDFASSVSNVQIQRGVGSSTNGAGAFGATISFNTNEVNTKAYAELNNSAGSFNSFKNTIKLGTGLINNKFTLDARLSKINSDGFIDRAKTNMWSTYASAAYLGKKTSVRFNFIDGSQQTYQAWYGIPEAKLGTNRRYNIAGTERSPIPYDDETDNYRQTHYQLFINNKLSTNLKSNITLFYTKGRGYYEQYKADETLADYGLPNAIVGTNSFTSANLVRQLWLDNDFYGSTYTLDYSKNRLSATFGGALTQYKGKHFGEVVWTEYYNPNYAKWYNNHLA